MDKQKPPVWKAKNLEESSMQVYKNRINSSISVNMKSKDKECKCLKCVWGTIVGNKVLCMFWRCAKCEVAIK